MGVLEIWEGAETEYVFNALQFILFMEFADAEDVYAWPLPEDEDLTDEDYILSMHDLIKRGFIEITEDEEPVYSLSLKARELFGDIFHAVTVLECVSAWEGILPCLIYRGASACTGTQWDLEEGYISVVRIDPSKLGTWLEEAGYLPDHPFETEKEAAKALKYDPQTKNALTGIRESIVCTPEVPAPLWALQENVRCVLRAADESPDGCAGMAVFFETDTESWILTCGQESGGYGQEREKEGWEIVPDSRERRKRIWRELI